MDDGTADHVSSGPAVMSTCRRCQLHKQAEEPIAHQIRSPEMRYTMLGYGV
jgi:hypothetical protein